MPLNSGLQIEQQQFSNWCWAASTQYICSILEAGFSDTQPQIVAKVLRKDFCAINPQIRDCNETCDFGEALNFYNHLDQEIDDILSKDHLEQLFRGPDPTPVGAQMNLPRTGGHAVVIIDARQTSSGLFVTIADPGDGSELTMPYETFRTDFGGNGGEWVRTYLTA